MIILYLVLMSCSIGILGVSVPDRNCKHQAECEVSHWTYPYPSCIDKECQCIGNNTCFVYTTDGSNTYFYCGTCGVLGSECNETHPCDVNRCKDDNFCHCDGGDIYREICVSYVPIPTTLASVILIVILVVMLILLRIIKSWNRIRSFICGRWSDTSSNQSTIVGINPNSGEKSAAYTITSSDFMVTSHDSDLEWALEFSRQLNTPREEWFSMDSLSWSSSSRSSSIRSSSSSRYHNHHSQSVAAGTLQSISEAGPSGLGDLVSRRRTTLSSDTSSQNHSRSSQRLTSSSPVSLSTSIATRNRSSQSRESTSTDDSSNPRFQTSRIRTESSRRFRSLGESGDLCHTSSEQSRSSRRSLHSLSSISTNRSYISTSLPPSSSPSPSPTSSYSSSCSSSSTESNSSYSPSSSSAVSSSLSSKALSMVRYLTQPWFQRSNNTPRSTSSSSSTS